MSFISWIKKLCLSIIDILRRLFLRPSDFSDVILEYRIAGTLRSGDLSKAAFLQKMYKKTNLTIPGDIINWLGLMFYRAILKRGASILNSYLSHRQSFQYTNL